MKVRRGPEVHFERPDPEGKRVSGPNLRPTECCEKKKKRWRPQIVRRSRRQTTRYSNSLILSSSPLCESRITRGPGGSLWGPTPVNSGAQHCDSARLGSAENTQYGGRHPREGSNGSRVKKYKYGPQSERRKAMEAAASLSGSDRGTQVQTAADDEPSDSDHESEASRESDGSGPAITPGTSDCII
ncbi:hypothetical protein NDU88_001922 [Pleurodeles waltl]|uniref:Uncharacterized protein n=1 Tax=Pleurodeles waltl TaxID=8319 RepID=A0AAV7V932_PLEWA|nr:hypothetical protein NDU88_001922 [Pleurodeles waltl]